MIIEEIVHISRWGYYENQEINVFIQSQLQSTLQNPIIKVIQLSVKLSTNIMFNMEGQAIQGSSRSACFINSIGIFQVLKDEKLVQYGLGVFFWKDQTLVTLSKYFQDGGKPGRIFFHKEQSPKQLVQFPQTLDLNKKLEEYEIYQSGTVELIGANKFFANIKTSSKGQLKKRTLSKVPMISFKDIQDVNYRKGLAIGLMKDSKDLTLFVEEYNVDKIENLSLPFKVGLLFVKKMSKTQKKQQLDFLYGFYDNLEEKEKGEDYYIYLQALTQQNSGGLGEHYFRNNKISQVKDQELTFPYNSIGVMNNWIGSGTAQFLYDKKIGKCSFMITCAHNFGSAKLSPQKLKQIKFLLKLPVAQQPERKKMLQLKEFSVQSVYIPKEYIEYISDTEPNTIPAYYPSNPEKKIRIKPHFFFDIAVVKLKEPIDLNEGFRIRAKEKPIGDIDVKNIEIAGFPRTEDKVNTVHMTMYKQSMEEHDKNDFQISQALEKSHNWRIIKHKLSTLSGNSGSPVYEREQDGQYYLLGIHTSGKPEKQGEQVYGQYNQATYLYSDHIYSWLMTIPGIESVIE